MRTLPCQWGAAGLHVRPAPATVRGQGSGVCRLRPKPQDGEAPTRGTTCNHRSGENRFARWPREGSAGSGVPAAESGRREGPWARHRHRPPVAGEDAEARGSWGQGLPPPRDSSEAACRCSRATVTEHRRAPSREPEGTWASPLGPFHAPPGRGERTRRLRPERQQVTVGITPGNPAARAPSVDGRAPWHTKVPWEAGSQTTRLTTLPSASSRGRHPVLNHVIPYTFLFYKRIKEKKKAGLALWSRMSPWPRHAAAPHSTPSSHCPSPCRGEGADPATTVPRETAGRPAGLRPNFPRPPTPDRTSTAWVSRVPGWEPCPGFRGSGRIKGPSPAPQCAASTLPASGLRAAVFPRREACLTSSSSPR